MPFLWGRKRKRGYLLSIWLPRYIAAESAHLVKAHIRLFTVTIQCSYFVGRFPLLHSVDFAITLMMILSLVMWFAMIRKRILIKGMATETPKKDA